MRKFVAYYRVSTARQGQSGLGLDAQRNAVKDYLRAQGWPPVAEWVEIESGCKNDRPELAKALRACRIHGATLVIAKLDRLARNAVFLLNLKDSGVEFVAVDMPHANRLTIGIMALVAEEEARAISIRTKAALAEAKKRGVKLGTPGNLSNIRLGAKNSAKLQKERADRFARDLMVMIDEFRTTGVTSYSGLARELTSRNIPTSRGKSVWSGGQVRNLMARASTAL